MARTEKRPGERLVAKSRFKLKKGGDVVSLRAGEPVPSISKKERTGLILGGLAYWEDSGEPEPEAEPEPIRDDLAPFGPPTTDDAEVEADA